MDSDEVESSSTSESSYAEANEAREAEREAYNKQKIGKCLAYLLRYGALKDNLTVLPGGFVKLADVMNSPLMINNRNKRYLMDVIESSLSYRDIKRFELKEFDKELYVRATYNRRFERCEFHEGTQVRRLFYTGLNFVADNIDLYDFDGFPDNYIVNELIHRMKRKKTLTNKSLEALINSNLENLDLTDVFISEKILKRIYKTCPSLKVLILNNCGCFLNDHYMELILKNCKTLEVLNLNLCTDLSDKTLKNICKYEKQLQVLCLSANTNYTEASIVDLVKNCQSLNKIDLFECKALTQKGVDQIAEILSQRRALNSFYLVNKPLKDYIAVKIPFTGQKD